jgi:hypothetical protein
MHNIQMKSTVLCALLLVGCAGQIQTNTTYDDSADFAAYRTFAQAPAPTYATDMPGYSEITGRNIQAQIANNLQQKGLQPASWDDADLQVSFTLGGQARQDTEYWGGWGWYGEGEVETENYVQGSLVIDMADRAKKRLVWHGFGTENLFSEGASDETLARAVDTVLAKYPPAASSGKAASTPAVSAEDEMPESPKVKADDM